MALFYYTSNSLIDSVKRRAMIPEASGQTFSAADFLNFANEEIMMGMLPSIMQVHEEFYVYLKSTTILPNRSNYSIPYRAIGSKLRDIFYRDNNGNLREMTRISADDRSFNSVSSDTNAFYKYYIQNDEVILLPNVGPTPTGELVMSYFLRPNQLVAEDRVATITAFDPLTGIITVNKIPANITASSLVDFLQTKPGHKTRSYDITVLSIDNGMNTITVAVSDVPPDLEVGDNVASQGECMIPQIPTDLHVMLSQRVAARCLEALGDVGSLQLANVKLQELEARTGNLIDNRTEGSFKKIVNLRGLLRSARIRKNWRR